MFNFQRIKRLPPYVFSIVDELKMNARRAGHDIVDFGMGNPDQPTPSHIVDKLLEAVEKGKNHRYSASRGITKLRDAICQWYARRYDVELDPESEAVVTIGSKEGIAHLSLSIIGLGDLVMVPAPTYPIHSYGIIIANGNVVNIPVSRDHDFFEDMERTFKTLWPRPKVLIINFPHNPTTACVDLGFFERIVDFARENNIIVIHDFAYADLGFDGYEPPSMLQVPGAKDVGVEFFSLSKSYNMPGWRVGFAVGNSEIIGALTRMKSYLDYGIFQPIQIASIIALNSPPSVVKEIRETYRTRRDILCDGLNRIGWKVEKPQATMFLWAEIPSEHKKAGSLEFAKFLVEKAHVAIAPGVGFGPFGDEHVRFALVENVHRTRQAIKGIKEAL
ncbi:MAG: aminotransferase class I/II-fold pyridoxal phosphate-dependent enzyme [bacterium]|nr:aminotransferase class I/II-fold pyridoxal phosphate-dependent enzyme [bacterium]MCZ6701118.1 aminotransferase class I/II-fold pyridoxal phosphate-dependent enzyme [bacterium]